MHTSGNRGATPTPTQAAQAALAAFLSGPVIQPRQPAWHPSLLTEQQQRERLALEQALRAGQLRRIPTVFGGLDEVSA